MSEIRFNRQLTYSTATLNFLIGPFLYLFVKRRIYKQSSKKEMIHFILPLLYLIYLVFSIIQPNEFKYNIYLNNFHPDWPRLEVHSTISNDPLHFNQYLDLVTGVQILFYFFLSTGLLVKKSRDSGESIFRLKDEVLLSLRTILFHFMVIVLTFIFVKAFFQGTFGDHFISIYITIFIIITTLRVINDSTYFDRTTSFLDIPIGKYRKSTLTETVKMGILKNIISEFEDKKYFSNNLATLSELAKKIGESPHHVSQVINEKLNQSFFELLASYRVEEAKNIFSADKINKLTVEEVSEMVGYNSKTAFNNAFKKLSGKTPSEFRKSANS